MTREVIRTIVSWYARVITRNGLRKDYHLYDRNRMPSGRPTLILEIENACGYANIMYGLQVFTLQCWKLPEVRKFHRTWLMEFDVEVANSTSKPKIKSASFDTSDKIMWNLREDFRSEGKFKPDQIVRLVDPIVNPWTDSTPSSGAGKRYDIISRKRNQYYSDAKNIPRMSHSPTRNVLRFQPISEKPLVKAWKEGIGASHEPD